MWQAARTAMGVAKTEHSQSTCTCRGTPWSMSQVSPSPLDQAEDQQKYVLEYYKDLSQEIGWSEVSLALIKIVFQDLLEREPFPITVAGVFHQDSTEGSWWNPGTSGSLSDRPGWRQDVLQHLGALSVVKANEKLSSVLLHKLAWGLLVLVHVAVLSTTKGRLISVSLADVLEVFEAGASRQRKRSANQSRALIIQDIIFMSQAKKTQILYNE